MQKAYTEMNRLKSKANSLHQILYGYQLEELSEQKGGLMVDVLEINRICAEIDTVISMNKVIKMNLSDFMSGLSEIVSFGDCDEQLNQAYIKISRLQELRDS